MTKTQKNAYLPYTQYEKLSMESHFLSDSRSNYYLFSDCSNGTFGDLCDNFCHCQGGGVCNKETGECPPGGCENGYFGSSCSLGINIYLATIKTARITTIHHLNAVAMAN